LKILQPPPVLRGTPIKAVVLTNGDIDHIGGLLSLREGTPFVIHATGAVLETLRANSIFDALDSAQVTRHRIAIGTPFSPVPGLTFEAFRAPGKLPLYMEGEAPKTDLESDYTIGLTVTDEAGRRLHYVPGCARLTDDLARRLDRADMLFFDGTLWQDDEMISEGLGHKTGRRMGHMPVSGEGGTLQSFAALTIGRKCLIHINNTNPILIEDSPQQRAVRAAGWEIAHDGMEVVL
jgi:pyrroloquinoline quinone biosynthesis protein B